MSEKQPISKEMIDVLLSISKSRNKKDMTEWEVDLFNDRLEAVKKYGHRAVITSKQEHKLVLIERRIRISKAKLEKLQKCELIGRKLLIS